MKRPAYLTVAVGALALSAGLILMPDTASYGSAAQSWDENHRGAGRFTVLNSFGGAAVRDNNTGLVWEQAPDGTPRVWGDGTSASATRYCVQKAVGGTRGWRLPSVAELASLIDPSLPTPFVPASAFTISTSDATPGVQSDVYWSATTFAVNPAGAWVVYFNNGVVTDNVKYSTPPRAWCVRGGMNADAY